MADSGITKKALADSIKSLMEEEDFLKISVADICNRCGMNRKSFYYHFKDKYDLVNWIFDMEFLEILTPEIQDNSWKLIDVMCVYFYDNRKFYRNALKIKGQNSFEEHFMEVLEPVVESSIKSIIGSDEELKFYIDFCMEAFIGLLHKWIMDKNCVEPEKFLERLKKCIHIIAMRDKQFYLE